MIGDTVDANVKWWNLDYIQSGSLLHEQVSNVDVSLVPEPKSEKDGHGYYHEYLQENAKAAAWYHKAALAGNARGAFNLAFAYNFGEGVPQNTRKAVYWWQQSAKDRHRPS